MALTTRPWPGWIPAIILLGGVIPASAQSPGTILEVPISGARPAAASPGTAQPAGSQADPTLGPRGVPVYYLFSAMGSDESYFNGLAVGSPATIWDQASRDGAQVLRANGMAGSCQMVPVRVASGTDVMKVLTRSLVPPDTRKPAMPYFVDQLAASERPISGFVVISHSGSDGPIMNGQMTYGAFQEDERTEGPERISNRLLTGAILRFAGCNSGNDYLWYEHGSGSPSMAHGAAAVLHRKKVQVHGKVSSGDVANMSNYVLFKQPDAATPYPTRHVIPKAHYKFYMPRETRSALIHFRSAEERDALLAWYAKRRIPVEIATEDTDGYLEARLPVYQTYTERSSKPAFHVELIERFRADPEGEGALTGHKIFGAEWDQKRGLLAQAIADAQRAGGGRLDIHDFRLWAVLLTPSQDHTVYRADLCDDPSVKDQPPVVY